MGQNTMSGYCNIKWYTYGEVLTKTFELTAHPIIRRSRFLFPPFLQFIECALKYIERTNLLRFRFLLRLLKLEVYSMMSNVYALLSSVGNL